MRKFFNVPIRERFQTFSQKYLTPDYLESKLILLLYISVCFPFVTPVKFGTDLQPWAMLISFAILVSYVIWKGIKNLPFQSPMFQLTVAFFVYSSFIALITLLKTGSLGEVLRSYASYLSLFFIPLASYVVFQRQKGLNERFMKWAINIWFVVGLVQKFYDYDFLYFILSNHRTSEVRGVISLAAEPSFYGAMCVFFLLFVLFFKKHKFFYIVSLLVQLLLFAESSVAMVYLLVFCALYFISCLIFANKKNLIIFGCIGALGALLWFFVLPYLAANWNTRAGILINTILNQPERLVYDGSVMERIKHIVLAFNSFAYNRAMPMGFSSFRLMSGYGIMMLECGIPSLTVLGMQLYLTFKANNRDKAFAFALAGGLAAMMFSAVQMATPLYSFYLAFCYYKIKNEDTQAPRLPKH